MEGIDLILGSIGAAATVFIGLVGIIAPRFVANFVGLETDGALGRTEVRATGGGLFIGLGAALVMLESPEAYLAAGLGWIGAAAARLVSMAFERAVSFKYVRAFAFEAGVGALMIFAVL